MLNEFIKYVKYFFYYIFYCYNKNDSYKLKKSNTDINLIDNNEETNKQELVNIFIRDYTDCIETNIYVCNICNNNIKNTHYLVYDKHFCSFNCRKKYLIKYQLL
jgi:hypothetical protein